MVNNSKVINFLDNIPIEKREAAGRRAYCRFRNRMHVELKRRERLERERQELEVKADEF